MTEIMACEVECGMVLIDDGEFKVVDGISTTTDGGAFGGEDPRLFIFDFVDGGGLEVNGGQYVEVAVAS